jgi:hypothetical protein
MRKEKSDGRGEIGPDRNNERGGTEIKECWEPLLYFLLAVSSTQPAISLRLLEEACGVVE